MPPSSALQLFREYITGRFDNVRQVDAERAAGQQVHPRAVHVNTDITARVRGAPAAGFILLEETYLWAEGERAPELKPLLLRFTEEAGRVVLRSLQWPRGAVPAEAMRADNPELRFDWRELAPSPTFPAPHAYEFDGAVFRLSASTPLPPARRFTLDEAIGPAQLEVHERVWDGGEVVRGWAAPLRYDRVTPPTLLRRATLIVRDADASLALYRDVLGLHVVYDEVLTVGGRGLPTGVFDAEARLVMLRSAEDHRVGVLGLLQFLRPALPAASPRRRLGVGDHVLVLNTTRARERVARARREVPRAAVHSEGAVTTYPAPGGGTVRVLENSLFDPDGNLVELNEILPTLPPPAGAAVPGVGRGKL